MVSANSRSVRTRGPPVTPMATAGGPLKQLESRLWRNNLILPAVRGKGLLDRQRHSGPEGPPYSADGSLAESADKARGVITSREKRSHEKQIVRKVVIVAVAAACGWLYMYTKETKAAPQLGFGQPASVTYLSPRTGRIQRRITATGLGIPGQCWQVAVLHKHHPPVFCRCMQEKRGCRRGDANVCETKGHRWELF